MKRSLTIGLLRVHGGVEPVVTVWQLSQPPLALTRSLRHLFHTISSHPQPNVPLGLAGVSGERCRWRTEEESQIEKQRARKLISQIDVASCIVSIGEVVLTICLQAKCVASRLKNAEAESVKVWSQVICGFLVVILFWHQSRGPFSLQELLFQSQNGCELLIFCCIYSHLF